MRFRKEWIGVVIGCLLVAWALSTVNPACSFSDIAGAMGVIHIREYGMLACLGIVLIAGIAVARVMRKKDDEP